MKDFDYYNTFLHTKHFPATVVINVNPLPEEYIALLRSE